MTAMRADAGILSLAKSATGASNGYRDWKQQRTSGLRQSSAATDNGTYRRENAQFQRANARNAPVRLLELVAATTSTNKVKTKPITTNKKSG